MGWGGGTGWFSTPLPTMKSVTKQCKKNSFMQKKVGKNTSCAGKSMWALYAKQKVNLSCPKIKQYLSF